MDSSPASPKRWLTKPLWIASLLAIAILLLVPVRFKLDGQTHADWEQFLGRFHPLAVHLPIGMILLVPLLEIGGRFRAALREAAGFVLGLSVLTALAAVTLGYLLAYGSGMTGTTVTLHMWGGICLAIGVLACFLVRPWWVRGELPWVYPALFAVVLGVLVWASHQGGSLTQGKSYLTEYLPASLRRWTLTRVKEPLVPGSFYAAQIDPIFDANCFACHSQTKVKGGLRLDSYNLLMDGGSSGAVIIPGKPDRSILFHRITLPPSDKHFMPAEGKPPLKPEEVALIRAWILQGASPSATTLAGVTPLRRHSEAPLPQVGDYSSLMGQIAQAEKTQGIRLRPVSQKLGDGLILNAIDVAPKFGDAQLAQLGQFAPYIVEAELEHTTVTDACFDTLAKFPHLRALHLEDTAVTGTGLAKLAQLSQLSYLNLSGTKVTQAALRPISAMKTLQHLYLYNTPAQPAVSAPAAPPPTGSPR